MSTTSQLGERVRSLLKAKGWSQAELSRRSQITPAVLSRVLSGERPATMDHVASLARALDTDPGDLVTGTEAEQVLTEWVPRTALVAAEKARIDAMGEVLQLRAELEVQVRQTDLLLRSLAESRTQIEELRLRSGAAHAKERREIDELKREAESREIRETTLRSQLEQAGRYIAQLEAWRTEASSRIAELQAILKQTGNDKVAIGLAGAGLGALLGILLAEPTSPRSLPKGRR